MENNREKSEKTVMVRAVSQGQSHRPQPPTEEPAIRQNNRRLLKASIGLIKDRGKTMDIAVTMEEIASKLAISPEQLEAYVNDEDRTPDDLWRQLNTAYETLLYTARQKINRESLRHSILWIRNHGLSKGLPITPEEMASKINLTQEQLYACLAGEKETPDDLAFQLESAYQDFLEQVDRVVMIEDIHLDEQHRKVAFSDYYNR